MRPGWPRIKKPGLSEPRLSNYDQIHLIRKVPAELVIPPVLAMT
jgi:hypothetical protein